ncbi:MAG: hypothetical protein WCV50_00915 [Patescibacteria group bacterium]|jgi:plastocyanin
MNYKKISQSLLFALILVLTSSVVILLAWYFIEGEGLSRNFSKESNGLLLSVHGNNIINLNGKFTPGLLVIKTGQSVTWKNEDSKPMQVVSEANQARYLPSIATSKLNKGEYFSFSFSLPGDWRYHDALNPKNKGRIIIE